VAIFSHPGLRHRHDERLRLSGADVNPVFNHAAKDGSVADDLHLRVMQFLPEPCVRTVLVRLEVGVEVEPLALVRYPQEARVKQLAKPYVILPSHRFGACLRCSDDVL